MKWEDMERMEGGEGKQDSWERGGNLDGGQRVLKRI